MSKHREQRNRPKVNYRDPRDDEIDVFTLSDTTSDSEEVIVLTTTTTTTRSPQQTPLCVTRNIDTIYAHLEERVKDQPALYSIAATISAAINRSFAEQDHDTRPRVTKMTIAGVSGCGKTETVLAIQSVLGIGPGTECEAQVVFLDGSAFCEASQVNAISGAAAGLLGYQDGHSIADRLNRAINKPPPPTPIATAIATITTIVPKVNKNTPVEVPYVAPRFIMLVVDELDKVSLDFLKAINGLIETGDYATPNNSVCFKKPWETTLFIVFTCNYGADAISAMKERDDELAEAFVVQHMRACRIPPYTIGRLGDIYPYYPLEREALQQLLTTHLNKHVANTSLAKQSKKKIDVSEEANRMLIDNVLANANGDMGLRGALKKLLRRVDMLFEKAFAVFCGGGGGGDGPIRVTGHLINACKIFDDWHIDKEEELLIIRSIKANQANRQTLTRFRNLADKGLSVKVLGISLSDTTPLCHLVLPLNDNAVVIPMNATTTTESQLHAFKETLIHVSRVASSATTNSRPNAVVKHIRDVVNTSLHQQGEEIPVVIDVAAATPTIKRKREVTRKAQEIDGFTAMEYLPTAKRYRYMCNECSQSVDSRRIATHQCIL